jgi:hypothetical protein
MLKANEPLSRADVTSQERRACNVNMRVTVFTAKAALPRAFDKAARTVFAGATPNH